MNKRIPAFFAVWLFFGITTISSSAVITLDFEGLADESSIGNFYNGGAGTNYGVTFSPNALALIKASAGGTGNFDNEPSASTVMFFLTGTDAKMTVNGGFDNGFSFWYAAISYPGYVGVYDTYDNLLASIDLSITPSNIYGVYSPFYQIGVDFQGRASYVSFAGVQDKIGFDNITFGSSTPGGGTSQNPPPIDPNTPPVDQNQPYIAINPPPNDLINLGECSETTANKQCTAAGNPINVITGDKFHKEIDIAAVTGISLGFIRYYNSQDSRTTSLGTGWRSIYDRSITFPDSTSVKSSRPDGHVDSFSLVSNNWQPGVDTTSQLFALLDSNSQVGWKLITSDDTSEIYTLSGQLSSITTREGITTSLIYDTDDLLIKVTGPFGHTLLISHDSSGLISSILDSGGSRYQYAYDTNKNLILIVHPDGTSRQYHYENSNIPNSLTGITDENSVRYATWTYDNLNRALTSEHTGGIEKVTIDYDYYIPIATDSLGNSTFYEYTKTTPLRKLTRKGVTNCNSDCGSSAYSYDSKGYLISRTDPNGNITTYTRDARGLELTRTEASETLLARTITTIWHPTRHLPLNIIERERTTTFTYDEKGNLLRKVIESGNQSKTWSYTYNNKSQVLTVIDQRGKMSAYTYNDKGGVATITNPLGQVTRINSYDAKGYPLSITDPNGLITTLAYDARGRITSLIQESEVTSFTYDKVGNLTKIQLPDGSRTAFIYDSAHRLTAITDGLGNRIVYTLDIMSNPIKEEVFGSNSQLARTLSHTYDNMGRLATSTGSRNQIIAYFYDSNSNLLKIIDPLNKKTGYNYDALNRLTKITNPVSNSITIDYNISDKITNITDQRSLKTSYLFNKLDDLTAIQSPDTGATTRTFDAAGNALTSTDARGKKTIYAYDALSRLVSSTFEGGNVTYQYDQGTNGLGHLTKMTDPNGATTWSYDSHGRVVQKQQLVNATTLTTSYQYDPVSGRLTAMTYPSGKNIGYTYNVAGQVTGMSVNGSALISNTAYQPFASPASWTQGNGKTYNRSFDQDGKITGISIGGSVPEIVSLTYDVAGRITQISNSAATAIAATTDTTALQYSNTSNRLVASTGSAAKRYTYDAAGNTISDGVHTFSYDGRERLVQVVSNGQTTQYLINGLGQRVGKNTTLFVYDESGHLLGEYNGGAVVQETIWLGDLPVGVITATSQYYINPDHLGAPLSISNNNGDVVWRWDHDPYGRIQPNQNPNNLGTFVYNLRFPGQYYDQESGLYYNWNRFYAPTTGRYVSADPIGLGGGMNLYAYVQNNPLMRTDPRGLDWLRQPDEPYKVGRKDTIIPEGQGAGAFLDDYWPGAHTLGVHHDAFVDYMTTSGFPDILINIPSMPIIYGLALTEEIIKSPFNMINSLFDDDVECDI